MSVEQKKDVWSSDLYKIQDIMTINLPTFLDQTDKFHMLNVCPTWNNMLQKNKLFWRGKFVLSNTKIKQIALNSRQKILNSSDTKKLNGFTNSDSDEIYKYLNLVHNWIIKMQSSLQLINELTIDLILPSIISNSQLIKICHELVSFATIKTLEIVSSTHYLNLITKCAPTLNNLILNVRDEYYVYNNLHLKDGEDEEDEEGYKISRCESDEVMHEKMLTHFVLFHDTYNSIQFSKLTNYTINIGSTTLENKRYRAISCLSLLCDEFDLKKLPNLQSCNFAQMEITEKYHTNGLVGQNDSLKTLQTKCSKLDKINIKCLGTEANFVRGELTKFVLLPSAKDIYMACNYIIKQIESDKLNLDNMDISCCVMDAYIDYEEGDSLLTSYKDVFDHIDKITIQCTCETPLVMHKHIKTDIINYQIANPFKEKIVVVSDKYKKEDRKTMKISCQDLNKYININELLQTTDCKTKLHIDIICEYCQSGENCNVIHNGKEDEMFCWKSEHYYCKCKHKTDCTDQIIDFMIEQLGLSYNITYSIYFNHKSSQDIEDVLITSRIRKLMDISQANNLNIGYHSLYSDARGSQQLFNNYGAKLDICYFDNACQYPITIKDFPNGLQSLDFFETKKIEFLCKCETRSKNHHRQQIDNIKKFVDDNIIIHIHDFNIKCRDVHHYFTKGDLEYFYTRDYRPVTTINIICDCDNNPKCKRKIEAFIKENELNDIKVSYVVKKVDV